MDDIEIFLLQIELPNCVGIHAHGLLLALLTALCTLVERLEISGVLIQPS